MDIPILCTSIISVLPIPMNSTLTSSIQMHILTTSNPPKSRILKVELKETLLPHVKLRTELDRPSQGYIDMLEETEIKGREDCVGLVQHNGAAIVAVFESLQDLGNVVSTFCTAWLDEADLFGVPACRQRDAAVGLDGTWKNLRSRREVSSLSKGGEGR